MTTALPGGFAGHSSRAQGPGGLDCVVLCGGPGSGLADALREGPRPLTEVAGRPFLEWVLLGLRRQGVTDVVLAVGQRGDRVEERLADGGHLGLRLRYSREPAPLGTGGALRYALRALRGDALLVVNGDTYCDIPVAAMVAAHRRHLAGVTVLASHVGDRTRYGAVDVGADGGVLCFGEKSARGPGLASCGAYIVSREVLEALPDSRRVDLESEVLAGAAPGTLAAVVTDGPFVDVATPASAVRAAEAIEAHARPLLEHSQGDATAHVRAHLEESAAAMRRVADRCSASIVAAAELVAATFTAGGKLLICGNGGSAADSQHVAAEFVSRLDRDFDRAALPAIALTTDTSFLTAYANDVDFDGVFSRQVEALGRPGDTLLAISTSGSSRNVRRAVDAARRRGMHLVGLFGEGAPLADAVDVAIVVPSRATQTTQECMLAIEHAVCEVVEQVMFGTAGVADAAARAAS